MKRVILFISKSLRASVVSYIVKTALGFGLELELMYDIKSVNDSEVKYVLTRGIPKSILYTMKDKIWYNDLELSKLVDDKSKTKEFLITKGFSEYLPKSYTLKSKDLKFPLILKDSGGTMGSNVYLCRDLDDIEKLELLNKGVDFMMEEYIGDDDGVAIDYRAYMMDFKPKLFIKRTNDGITSNVSNGGEIEVIEAMFEEELISISKAIPLNISAIDFTIDNNGNFKLFEINSSPGITALYQRNIDVYKYFFQWYSKYVD